MKAIRLAALCVALASTAASAAPADGEELSEQDIADVSQYIGGLSR
jgi:hypothetical protein